MARPRIGLRSVYLARVGPRLALWLCGVILSGGGCGRSTVPTAIGEQDFWTLIESLSEPPGRYTLSDNLVSNEVRFAESARRLRPAGGVYIGVGPEQNFSYIARLRPAIAFIVDIRRENRDLHLLYKALFELSADRADFVARLFSRARPVGLGSSASAAEIFKAFEATAASPAVYDRNAALVRERLLFTRRLPLSAGDLESVERAFKAFYEGGPAIDFWRGRAVDGARPSYQQLMTTRDWTGEERSFLASEDGFRVVKDLHQRNLIVPLVGDFGGTGAIRRIGEYVRAHGDVVQAFYGSNVGVYLTNQQMRAFCGNLESLPAASGAWFIESDGLRTLASKLKVCSGLNK